MKLGSNPVRVIRGLLLDTFSRPTESSFHAELYGAFRPFKGKPHSQFLNPAGSHTHFLGTRNLFKTHTEFASPFPVFAAASLTLIQLLVTSLLIKTSHDKKQSFYKALPAFQTAFSLVHEPEAASALPGSVPVLQPAAVFPGAHFPFRTRTRLPLALGAWLIWQPSSASCS